MGAYLLDSVGRRRVPDAAVAGNSVRSTQLRELGLQRI